MILAGRVFPLSPSLIALPLLVLAGCASLHDKPLPPLVAAQEQPPADEQFPLVPVEEPGLYIDSLTHQLRPEPPMPTTLTMSPEMTEPAAVITHANNKARQAPSLDHYLNAIERWPYQEGRLYQVYTMPGRMTTIILSPDEQLVEYLVGDPRSEFWLFDDTAFGPEGQVRSAIAVSPQEWGLMNNMIVFTTSGRTYAIELISPQKPPKRSKWTNSYMVQVEWTYPDVEARKRAAQRREQQMQRAEQAAEKLDLSKMNFRYDIRTKSRPIPRWMPMAAFDDGLKVFIRFPDDLPTTEAPVLYVDAGAGGNRLVNYRKKTGSHYYEVDALFSAAELRVGGKGGEVVRILRRED
jgi:P-type conjugative transfer protein TrbG